MVYMKIVSLPRIVALLFMLLACGSVSIAGASAGVVPTDIVVSAAGEDAVSSVSLPLDSGSGRRLVYANSLQRVWVVSASGSVVRTFLVTGLRGVPLPGHYKVFSQSLLSHSMFNRSVSMRFMTRFALGPNGGNIGFHEIPTRNGRPLQSEAQLGQFGGAGCLRSATTDAKFVYSWARIGTKVVVVP